jgi:hypothetical protein
MGWRFIMFGEALSIIAIGVAIVYLMERTP